MNSDSKLFAVGWYPFAATGLPTDIQQAAYGNASNLPSVVHIPNLDTVLLGTTPRGRCVGCRTRWVVGHVCSPNRKRTCTSPHRVGNVICLGMVVRSTCRVVLVYNPRIGVQDCRLTSH